MRSSLRPVIRIKLLVALEVQVALIFVVDRKDVAELRANANHADSKLPTRSPDPWSPEICW